MKHFLTGKWIDKKSGEIINISELVDEKFDLEFADTTKNEKVTIFKGGENNYIFSVSRNYPRQLIKIVNEEIVEFAEKRWYREDR